MKFLSAPKNEQFIEYKERYDPADNYELYETETHFLYVEIEPGVDELIETETCIVTNLVIHEALEFGFAVNNQDTPGDIFYCTKTEAYSSDLMLLAKYNNDFEHDLEYLNDHTLFVTDRTGFVNIKRFSGKSLQLIDVDTVVIKVPNNRSKTTKTKALTQMFGEIGIKSTQLGSDFHKDLLSQLANK